MSKLFFGVSIFSIFCSSALLVAALIVLLYPFQPIIPNVQPYKVITSTVKAGDFVEYTVDACKNMAIPAAAFRKLVPESGPERILGTEQTNLKPGCSKSEVDVLIPDNTPTGEYYLQISLTYQVYGIRPIGTTVKTEKFFVEGREP